MRIPACRVVVLVVCGLAATAQAKLVACVGDSITYGSGIANRTVDSYPAQLQRLLRQYDLSWEVQNFWVSGATLLSRGDLPYVRQAAFANAQACNPDIVIIKLGTNDSKPQNWQYRGEFVRDYENMIDTFRALPSRPQVWICKPAPAFYVNFDIRPDVIRDDSSDGWQPHHAALGIQCRHHRWRLALSAAGLGRLRPTSPYGRPRGRRR